MKAFTLVETMVAVTILTLAVVGPMMVASRSIVAAQIARSQLTANYLAQEGIEYVRAMRDNKYLATRLSGGDAWGSFLIFIGSCREPGMCTLDQARDIGVGPGFSLEPCSDNNCKLLYLTANGYNQQNDGTPTPFRRTIQVVNIPGTSDGTTPYPDKRVVSKVWWDFHGTTYTVTVTDHLTPWQ